MQIIVTIALGSNEFDSHWGSYSEEIPLMKLVVAERFLSPLFKKQYKSVLDAGCGDGVHAVIIDKRATKGTKYVGVDISKEALLIAKKRSRSTFIQCDISKLPFNDDTFDAVFSFGVLAYTKNPYKSFMELCRVTKKRGLVGVWIMPRQKGLKGLVFTVVRRICSVVGPLGTRFIADMLVPVLGLMNTRSKLSLRNATWKQCREIVLVNIAPSQLQFMEPQIVAEWYKQNNIEIIENDFEHPITLWGRKN